MKVFARLLPLLLTLPLFAQGTPQVSTDPWHALLFLQGTWSASTTTALNWPCTACTTRSSRQM